MPKADLENKKFVFLQIGLVIVLSLVLIASEWSTPDVKYDTRLIGEKFTTDVDVIPPITLTKEVKPPPPPPPPKPADVITIVDNETPLDKQFVMANTEMDNQGIDITAFKIEEVRDEDVVVAFADEMPEFPGGEAALMRYLANAVKYPTIAQQNNIQGRVYVQFVVSKTGEITNVLISRGVDPSLDKEAIRVVESMPNWKPGKQRGRPVRVSFTVPINFVLK